MEQGYRMEQDTSAAIKAILDTWRGVLTEEQRSELAVAFCTVVTKEREAVIQHVRARAEVVATHLSELESRVHSVSVGWQVLSSALGHVVKNEALQQLPQYEQSNYKVAQNGMQNTVSQLVQQMTLLKSGLV